MKKIAVLVVLGLVLGCPVANAGFFDEFNLTSKFALGKMQPDKVALTLGFDFWKGTGDYKALRSGLGYIGETKVVYADVSVNLKDLAEKINMEWLLPYTDIVVGYYIGGNIQTGEVDQGASIGVIKLTF